MITTTPKKMTTVLTLERTLTKVVEMFDGISLLSGAEFDYNNPANSAVTIDNAMIIII